MKKPKIRLDKDALQQFFLLHIEKILLGVIVCLMLLLVWRGFSLPHPFSKDQTPQALVDKSTAAQQYINDPERWVSQVAAKRTPVFNIKQAVAEVQKKSDPLAYMLVNTWQRSDFPKLTPREDPEIFAPINLIVRPNVGVIASYPRSEAEYIDPLYPQMNEDELRKMREQQKRNAKKAKADLAGGEGMPGSSDGMMGTGRAKKKKGAAGGEESAPSPRGGSLAGMPGGEYGGMGMGMGMGGVPGDRYLESVTYGYQVQDPTNTIARYLASVTIMAVVPIQRQVEEFDKKLSESLDYEPNRDRPHYRDFRVQRADVTDLDPGAPVPEDRWTSLGRTDTVLAEIYGNEQTRTPGLYAGFPTEVVDPSYLSPEVLTHPAPPYLQRDLWDLLTHPDVPLAAAQGAMTELVPGKTPANTPNPDEDAPIRPAFGPGGGAAGMPGGGEGMPGGMGGFGGMRGGFGGGMRGSADGGLMGGGGFGGGMRGAYSGGTAGGGMMGGGGFRPGALSGEAGTGGYGTMTYTPPKYQLIRYTDMNVKPGHKYRYRLQVYLHDPNHPPHGFTFPSAASLHDSVRKRLEPIEKAEATRPKDQATGLPYRRDWVTSSWSEASPLAEVPSPARVFAAKVLNRAPQKITMGPRVVDVQLGEPIADAVAVVFDPAKTTDVPAESRLYRGSLVNFTQAEAIKVIHPVNKEIIEIQPKDAKVKYDITTNALVADMLGGEPIKSVTAIQTPLTTIGEMLVVDANGKLHVQDESKDIEQIRRYTLPKPDPKAAKAAADAASGLSGETPGRPVRGRGSDLP